MDRTEKNTLYMNNDIYYLINEDILSEITDGWSDDNYLIISVDLPKATLEMFEDRKISDNDYRGICEKNWNEFNHYLQMKQYAYIPLKYVYKNNCSEDLIFKDAYIVYPFSNFNGNRKCVDREVFREDILYMAEKYKQTYVLSKLPKQSAKCLSSLGDIILDLEREKFTDILDEYFGIVKRCEFFLRTEAEQPITYIGTYFTKPSSIMNSHCRASQGELVFPPNKKIKDYFCKCEGNN